MKGIAVITGASSGIGKALAFEFAKRGHSLVLTGRNEDALNDLADELNAKYGVDARIIVADLAVAADVKKLAEDLAVIEVGILVNNAGFGVKGDFAETDIDDELSMIDVQLSAMLRLTKAVLPSMRSKRSGLILNVASVYSFSPVPQQSVYAAAKSFIYSFSSSLRSELKASGVNVSVLAPGITQTEFRTRAGIADKKGAGMTAEAVAEIGVEQALNGKFLIVPGLQNKAFVFVTRHLPVSLAAKLIEFINNRRGLKRS